MKFGGYSAKTVKEQDFFSVTGCFKKSILLIFGSQLPIYSTDFKSGKQPRSTLEYYISLQGW